MMKRHIVSVLMGGVLLTGLSGCGGGGSSDSEPTNGIQNITVTPLSSQNTQYDEHEIVVLSLDTQGDNVGSVTYDWVVEYSGSSLAFSGQNTQEISFEAPEVDGLESVSVSVTLGMANGNLLGNNRYLSTVFIYDLDPIQASSQGIIVGGLSTILSQVNSLNPDLTSEDTTWRLNTYLSFSTLPDYGFDGEFYIATQQISYFDLDNSGDVGFRRCGSNLVEPFIPSVAQSSCSGIFERKLYQSTTSFRVEEVCDGDVRFVTNFTKLRNDQAGTFGEVSLTFSTYDDFSTTSNVCGAVSETVVVVHEDDDNDGYPDNTVSTASYAELHAQYEGSPIKVVVDIDDIKSYWSYQLNDFFDPNELNDIQFDSPALSKLDGFSANDGSLSVDRSSSGIEVDVDAEIIDVDSATQVIEGSFSLIFE